MRRSRGDRVGVVGLDEFEAFGFELVALDGQELAFVLAGSFELVEHVVEDLPDVLSLGLGQVVAFDLGFGVDGVPDQLNDSAQRVTLVRDAGYMVVACLQPKFCHE